MEAKASEESKTNPNDGEGIKTHTDRTENVPKWNKFLYEKNKIIKNTLTNAFYLMRILCFAAQAHFILFNMFVCVLNECVYVVVGVFGPMFVLRSMEEHRTDQQRRNNIYAG